MDRQVTHQLVEALRGVVDALLSSELSALSSVEVTGMLAELEVQRRRLEAVDAQVVTELTDRGVSHEYGRHSTADLLTSLLRVSPGEAKARVARAQDLARRRGLTGEALDPILPLTAAAVRAGELSPGHVAVIAKTLEAIPAVIAYQAAPLAEALLVQAARHEHPRQLTKTATLLLVRLDPDGLEPRDEAVERRRGFSLVTRGDGSSIPRGEFTAELTALLQTLFDSLAAPVPATDGMADHRSPAQRRHDALADAATRLIRSTTLPAAGGVPVTILARMNATDLAQRTGVALTGHGDTLSLTTLLAMAADAEIIPVVCTELGGILAYGRTRRLASKDQRLALAARDGGCSFPGCDRPPAWAEVHHVKEWLRDDGETNIDQMCLVCRYHHRHFARYDWTPVMINGVPHWIPPAWLDPHRRPLRNTTHHLDDFTFGPGKIA